MCIIIKLYSLQLIEKRKLAKKQGRDMIEEDMPEEASEKSVRYTHALISIVIGDL